MRACFHSETGRTLDRLRRAGANRPCRGPMAVSCGQFRVQSLVRAPDLTTIDLKCDDASAHLLLPTRALDAVAVPNPDHIAVAFASGDAVSEWPESSIVLNGIVLALRWYGSETWQWCALYSAHGLVMRIPNINSSLSESPLKVRNEYCMILQPRAASSCAPRRRSARITQAEARSGGSENTLSHV